MLPVTRFTEERFVAELESRGISVWSPGITGPASAVRGLWRLLRHLRARRPQVVCTFMFHANVPGAVLGRLAGVPVVVSSIRNERFGPRWRERLEALTQRLCDVTVLNSERVAASLIARGIVRKDRCRVIPNAVDVARFSPDGFSTRESTRRRLVVPPEAFLWLTVGRLEPQKDHESLLRAAAGLREQHSYLRVALAGDGPLRDSLQRLSRRMALEDVVCWLGVRTDVPDLLAASDAFVLSSRWEGSPNALLEALAAALPVVATDVGGVRDLVEDGRSGYLVPPADAEALGTAMGRVMTLPRDQRLQLGRRGRDSVRQHRSLERRFQAIKVDPPSERETIEVLTGVKDRYSRFHHVASTMEAIEAAVYQSNRYITDRFLPDKAIDLIDEAGARAKLREAGYSEEFGEINRSIRVAVEQIETAVSEKNFEKAQFYREQEVQARENLQFVREKFDVKSSTRRVIVGKGEIDEVVSKWTGVPLTSINQDEGDKLLHMEDSLHKRVISQDAAISALSRAIRRSRAGLKSPNRPVGSFIFLGPTGVGKTELARAIANFLFGSDNALIRLTCRSPWRSARCRS